MPTAGQNITNEQIVDWTNHPEFQDFFDSTHNWNVGQQSSLEKMAHELAYGGGCKDKNQWNITSMTNFLEMSMFDYCCSSKLDDDALANTSKKFPYYQNWTLEKTYAFRTCSNANRGNPDIGGNGVGTILLFRASNHQWNP